MTAQGRRNDAWSAGHPDRWGEKWLAENDPEGWSPSADERIEHTRFAWRTMERREAQLRRLAPHELELIPGQEGFEGHAEIVERVDVRAELRARTAYHLAEVDAAIAATGIGTEPVADEDIDDFLRALPDSADAIAERDEQRRSIRTLPAEGRRRKIWELITQAGPAEGRPSLLNHWQLERVRLGVIKAADQQLAALEKAVKLYRKRGRDLQESGKIRSLLACPLTPGSAPNVAPIDYRPIGYSRFSAMRRALWEGGDLLGEVDRVRTFLRKRYPEARLGERRRGDDLEARVLVGLRHLGASYDDIEVMRTEHPKLAELLPERTTKARRDRVNRYMSPEG